MKKLILLFALIGFFAFTNAQNILWPSGAADVRTSTDSLTSAIASVYDDLTVITYAELDTVLTVTATLSDELRAGARLFLFFDADASARTVTYSTGLTGGTTSVTGTKTFWVGFLYNGSTFTKFIETQID